MRNGIDHRLTFENPAGHRKSQSRVAHMHQSHRPPQVRRCGGRTEGEELCYEPTLATRHRRVNAPKVLWASTEVIRGHMRREGALITGDYDAALSVGVRVRFGPESAGVSELLSGVGCSDIESQSRTGSYPSTPSGVP